MAQREIIATSLAVANGHRGPHSWGVYTVTRSEGASDAVEVIKRVGNIANEHGLGTFGIADTMLGHTRWKTTGDVSETGAASSGRLAASARTP